MPSSNSEARSRVTMFVLVMLPLGACATAMDLNLPGQNPLAASGAGSEPSTGGSGSANGGSPAGG
ncbi:MAG TPA: hypothetical protein VJV79_11115, partial [Polyangiaceae bacterium]|nr:hypothetical protein [Polyangiaceae bacterium]